MNRPTLSATVLCLALSARSSFAADSSGPPDTVLFDGKVFTADASHPQVEALAIRGDRINLTAEGGEARIILVAQDEGVVEEESAKGLRARRHPPRMAQDAVVISCRMRGPTTHGVTALTDSG